MNLEDIQSKVMQLQYSESQICNLVEIAYLSTEKLYVYLV